MTERLFLGLLAPSEILAILTGVLVLVTLYYAIQTRQMVVEMEKARGTTVLPRIAVSMNPIGGMVGWVRLTNVGPGPAMNIQAAITSEPNGFEISWHAHVVAPNEAHDFIPTPPGEPEAQLGYLDRLTERYDRIRLDASYSDALGKSHETHESIEIREWWGSLKSAGHLVTQDYPAETVKELAKIGTAVGKIASEAAKERLRLQLLRGPWRWEIRIRRLPSRLQPIARRVARRIGISRV
jgi:hypothetical protein